MLIVYRSVNGGNFITLPWWLDTRIFEVTNVSTWTGTDLYFLGLKIVDWKSGALKYNKTISSDLNLFIIVSYVYLCVF